MGRDYLASTQGLATVGSLPPLPPGSKPPGTADSTPTRPNTQQQSSMPAEYIDTSTPGIDPTPKLAASQARSTHPPLPFFGHFDVTTSWDFDHPALDATAYSPQLGFSRFMFAYVPFSSEAPVPGTGGMRVKPGPADERAPATQLPGGPFSIEGTLARKFESLKVGDSVEIKEMATWARQLHPRGVQDLKPLLVLCQGLLRGILDEKYSFYCEEILVLRDQLAETTRRWKEDIESMNQTIESLQQNLSEQQVQAGVVDKFKTAMAKMKQGQAEQEKVRVTSHT